MAAVALFSRCPGRRASASWRCSTACSARGLRRIAFDLKRREADRRTGRARFIYCLSKVQEIGGKLWMAGAQGYVRECFRVTRLDTIFQFCGTVEDALAANQPR